MLPLAENNRVGDEGYSHDLERGVLDWSLTCYGEYDSPYRQHRHYSISPRPPARLRHCRKEMVGAHFIYFPSKADIFDDLVAKWREESRYESLTYRVAMSEAYQEMIALGAEALPRILACLETDPSPHWFWALKVIAREDPAHGEDTVGGAVEAWLRWGRSRNLLPG